MGMKRDYAADPTDKSLLQPETWREILETDNPVPQLWDQLSPLPGGRMLFSKLIGFAAPYTSTIKPYVAELREGYCRVEMEDQRRVRNHLNSIHAMALTNLGEAASGLGVVYSLPNDMRGILTGFEIEYVKKARGLLTAESDVMVPSGHDEQEIEVPVTTRDEEGDVVTRATAKWKIGPT